MSLLVRIGEGELRYAAVPEMIARLGSHEERDDAPYGG